MKHGNDPVIFYSLACLDLHEWCQKNPGLDSEKYIKKAREILKDTPKNDLLYMAALGVASAVVFDQKIRNSYRDMAKNEESEKRSANSRKGAEKVNDDKKN